ncbi:hypothetical protein ACU8KH_00826 [Lachancea thermotolerans]
MTVYDLKMKAMSGKLKALDFRWNEEAANDSYLGARKQQVKSILAL